MDEAPAEYPAWLEIDYPELRLGGLRHCVIVLALLGIAATVCVIVAWFAILFTGRYPRSLFDFVVAVFRWWLRVAAYAFLLTTDRYPPFRLGEGY